MMKSNYISGMIILLAMVGNLNAKNMHKVFGTDDKIIKGSGKIIIYSIDDVPVMSIEQVQGQDYIYDYHVTQAKVLKKKEALGIINAALDTNQYLYGTVRKCPFMGKYAVQFRKGLHTVTLIISNDPCAKAIVFCPGSIIDKKHIDLIDNSTLLLAISAAIQTKVIQNKK